MVLTQDRLGQAICGVILQNTHILHPPAVVLIFMMPLGDCQLESLIKTHVGEDRSSHFITTRMVSRTLVSLLRQSAIRMLRISHQLTNRSPLNG